MNLKCLNLDTKFCGRKSWGKNLNNAKDKKSVLHAASPAHNVDGSHHYICLQIANISHVDEHDDGGKIGAHYVIF